MKRPIVIFFVVLAAAIIFIAVLKAQQKPPLDVPVRTPTKAEIVPSSITTFEVIKTSDEARIPDLMRPTGIVTVATRKLIDTSCPAGTKRCNLQAVYDFVRKNYEYQISTPEHTYIQSPGETLIRGTGDELDIAILLASMQRAAGFENQILRSRYHTFVRVKLDNQSIMMDPSCQGCQFMEVNVALSGEEDVFS